MTRARDSNAAFSSKDGFSVVAPTRTTVPSSMTGKKAILLGAVEAMDLVDEKQGLATVGAAQLGRLEDFLQIGNAGKHRRYLLESRGWSRRRAALPPWSCRCLAAPRRSSNRANLSRSAGSARHRGRSDAPGQRPRQGFSAAACRPAAVWASAYSGLASTLIMASAIQRMGQSHVLAIDSCLRGTEARDQLHRARTVKRHQRDDVLAHAGAAAVAQHALHAHDFAGWNTATDLPSTSAAGRSARSVRRPSF